MALRQVRVDGDPILRKRCREVKEINEKIEIIVEDMIETMYKANGVGLAAPQIGILKRIFVIDIYDDNGVTVFINPEILDQKGEIEDTEGCLSVPHQTGQVKRPEWVKVKATNLDGEEFILEGEELLARAICHENDHLNGILYIDKATDMEMM